MNTEAPLLWILPLFEKPKSNDSSERGKRWHLYLVSCLPEKTTFTSLLLIKFNGNKRHSGHRLFSWYPALTTWSSSLYQEIVSVWTSWCGSINQSSPRAVPSSWSIPAVVWKLLLRGSPLESWNGVVQERLDLLYSALRRPPVGSCAWFGILCMREEWSKSTGGSLK